MISQDEITKFSITEYSFLCDAYGFKSPLITKESWSTQIDYRKGEIAIEINLDFRDFIVELFVVRLEAGKLPKGYYVSAGKKSRIYLLHLITNKNWSIDEIALQNLQSKTNRSQRGDSNYFKEELRNYRVVLSTCIDKILEERTNLFN